jgi:hypothetical protein
VIILPTGRLAFCGTTLADMAPEEEDTQYQDDRIKFRNGINLSRADKDLIIRYIRVKQYAWKANKLTDENL